MSVVAIQAPGSDQFRAAFREEAVELLRDLEASLLNLQDSNEDPEAVAGIFRNLHTIKGSGAMFGFTILASFTHHLENAFDAVRDGRVTLSRELIDLALQGIDHMRGLILNAHAGDRRPRMALVDKVTRLIASGTPGTSVVEGEATPTPQVVPFGDSRVWGISFTPGPDMMRFGSDPALLIRELAGMGQLEARADLSQLPSLTEIDPERCYASWELALYTGADENVIRDVFIFVEDLCFLRICSEDIEEAVAVPAVAQTVPDSPEPRAEVDPIVRVDASASPAAIKDRGPVEAGSTSMSPQQAKEAKSYDGGDRGGIRVAASKLDQLINLVGELVTVQARLSELALRRDDNEISSVAEEVERLTSSLRESSMNVRMMPVRNTFERFRRLVYDLARDLSKSVNLTIEGAETELDKTVLDQLSDPLLHLIRNSMDHGLETTGDRLRAGKSEQGHLHLSARHSGASVLIGVSDDGRGIDIARVRQRGIERGLISADAVLSESEIFSLIFEPGFSTAVEVTDLSGRGVGMDVVRRNIEKLRGNIDVASKPGKGTTVTLRIPLTLAIIDGLLVTIGDQYFVLPLAHTLECIELSRAEIDRSEGKQLINVRGELIAYIRLREYFGIEGDLQEFEQVMLVDTDSGRFGLVVDRVLGDCQTMVKSLGHLYQKINELSGATILGNGCVALILDPHRLVQECIRSLHPSARAVARAPAGARASLRAGPGSDIADANSNKIVPISRSSAPVGA
ncbi:two-component system, chemotaxis family, sensor kinase CheA [Bryocella elongata]|uniref:Chemotaxis protein CheA n=1 Tax=Bryocella elongata TaxID=863522 RepID=A0A1H5ZJN3_9BACT|nr:chemotaxis protein CheA [Bryocella elongata]SEG36753.1 two-component system, chemotaxis family, sensor kinase CheA [Bryocella elongata]